MRIPRLCKGGECVFLPEKSTASPSFVLMPIALAAARDRWTADSQGIFISDTMPITLRNKNSGFRPETLPRDKSLGAPI